MTYTNTGLTAATTYYYRVRANNAGGVSANTDVVSGTTNPNPPSAPSGLGATALSPTEIRLSWTDNSNNETGFQIDRSPNGSSSWTQIGTVGANVTTFNNTGLSPSTQYFYRVRSTNAGGNFGRIAGLPMRRRRQSRRRAPSALTTTTLSTTQIRLNWTDNANNETGFQIDRSANGTTGWTQIATVGANVVTYTNTGLTAATTYFYRVRANNGSAAVGKHGRGKRHDQSQSAIGTFGPECDGTLVDGAPFELDRQLGERNWLPDRPVGQRHDRLDANRDSRAPM